jgi:hypothetical protein
MEPSPCEAPQTPPERAPWRLANPMLGQDPAAGLFWVLIGLAAAVFVIAFLMSIPAYIFMRL